MSQPSHKLLHKIIEMILTKLYTNLLAKKFIFHLISHND